MRFEAEFTWTVTREEPVSCVTEVRPGAVEETGARPSVVIRRVERGEALWDIAKACGSTTQDIRAANGLPGEEAVAAMAPVSFRPYESVLKIDRKFSGSRRAIIHQRRCQVPQSGGCITFRMILDRFSVEIFVNDGAQTLSATMYTEQAADGFKFFADGKVSVDVEKYDLDADRE